MMEPGESDQPVLITGGAGFVGCNLAHRLCAAGRRVVIYDNLARPGVERNVAGLCQNYGERVRVEIGDMRDFDAINEATRGTAAVFHFAAQVAVTSSLVSPFEDFEINARGTLNLLEALRAQRNPPPVFFTSTNKVYGSLEDMGFRVWGDRYEPCEESVRVRGISENRPLDFYSPYGCSKGTADQYVLDYARTFGLRAVVFRMSCIYGPHQCGTEDQGWIAHFLIQALRDKSVTLYGDGRQVRDILYIDDLIDAFVLAETRIDELSGRVFNIGGGTSNTVSLLELLDKIEQLQGSRLDACWNDWRPGDQRYYVSNFSRFQAATGWTPKTGMREGIAKLYDWLSAQHHFRASPLPEVALTQD